MTEQQRAHGHVRTVSVSAAFEAGVPPTQTTVATSPVQQARILIAAGLLCEVILRVCVTVDVVRFRELPGPRSCCWQTKGVRSDACWSGAMLNDSASASCWSARAAAGAPSSFFEAKRGSVRQRSSIGQPSVPPTFASSAQPVWNPRRKSRSGACCSCSGRSSTGQASYLHRSDERSPPHWRWWMGLFLILSRSRPRR